MEIAVFQDTSGKTQSLFEPGIIKIYSRYMGEWKITREIIFKIDNIASLTEIRESIRNKAESVDVAKSGDKLSQIQKVKDGIYFLDLKKFRIIILILLQKQYCCHFLILQLSTNSK